ncbi:LamG domain-containing protein [bacterium]|nr:LamG domain-containing protein [bacterium]
MRTALAATVACLTATVAHAQLAPFVPDGHTVLLYHLDEGQGAVVRDASGHGQDAVLQGATWGRGRFGGGLWLDGADDSAFLDKPDALRALKQITVECWFKPERMSGRRFLIGHDVGFHFEVDDGAAMSISLYNLGGGVPNAEGKAHQQVLTGGVSIRPERWHHLAITYDGATVSTFLDGALRGRKPGPQGFALGAPSRGLWLGCYVGMDYWYSGALDEVRVSDVVRYDPEGKMKPGERIYEASGASHPVRPAPAVRQPVKTGVAALNLTLKKLHGGDAGAWVCLKPPGKPAVVVGEYACQTEGEIARLTLDVSDEVTTQGTYLVGLVPKAGGYFVVPRVEIKSPLGVASHQGGDTWEEGLGPRRTFRRPALVPLSVGAGAPAKPSRSLLLPAQADWATGTLELDTAEEGQPPLMIGDGSAEWWLHCPAAQTYRVYMRYAAATRRPCDMVVDGDDLNDFNMCARNLTERSTARDALWELQGTVRLQAGAHWLRVQDVLPDIVGVRLEPVGASGASAPTRRVPFEPFAVPPPDAFAKLSAWKTELQFGQGTGSATAGAAGALQFTAAFANINPDDLFSGDCLRFTAPAQWDLSPYGRLRFTFTGTGSQHVVSLRVVDAKGDEKLIWRQRDLAKEPLAVAAPLDFEGNDIFDPQHIVAAAVELDEGNHHPTQANALRCALSELTLDRRDTLRGLSPEGPQVPQGADPGGGRTGSAPDTARDRPLTEGRPLLSPGFRPWLKPVVPEEHPLYATTEPKPVTRLTLGYDLHFTGARGVSEGTLRNFHERYNFGDICWPHIGILPQRSDCKTDADYEQALKTLEERLQAVKQRNLIVFDIWGYVPNNELGRMWRVTPEHDAILKRVMGDRFLGYDNGEQDGRYIGAYAGRGQFTDRRGGWDDFAKWDEMICADSAHFMNATGSLNFSHYYGERGARTLGLETAQGLPSDTLMFAFLRGAAKQYGRLTTQATSIWNRYGYNIYSDRKTDGGNGYGFGPHKGCSLSLHRRLFFQSYTGGDSIVGTETAQFTADVNPDGSPELSPLGRQHLAFREWVQSHPDRGVMYAPIAFMLDFTNGWNMPRHLYRSDKYKIWGKLPYEKGDYLTDNIFRMVWPGYEDCSYFRNERGFICDTPYGDLFDVITNRCHPSVLQQYTALMLMGDVEITPAVAANLQQFVQQGGDVLMDAGHAAKLPPAFTGLSVGDPQTARSTARVGTKQVWPEQPYTLRSAQLQAAQPLLRSESGAPVMAVNTVGRGRVIVCLADNFMTDQLTYADPKLVNMESPYALLQGVRAVLDEYFASFSPVALDPPGLNVRVNCTSDAPRKLLVTLTNNNLFADWRGTLRVKGRKVDSLREWWENRDLKPGAPVTVPAGDVRVLEVWAP